MTIDYLHRIKESPVDIQFRRTPHPPELKGLKKMAAVEKKLWTLKLGLINYHLRECIVFVL